LFAVCIEKVAAFALYVSRRRNHTLGASFSAFAHTLQTAERKGSCEMNGRLALCLLAADAALIATINNDYAATRAAFCFLSPPVCKPAALIVRRRRRPPAKSAMGHFEFLTRAVK
jgi:hypothetical protein